MTENQIVTLAVSILNSYEEQLPPGDHPATFAVRLGAMIATIKELGLTCTR